MNLTYKRTCQSQGMVVMQVEMATATLSLQQQQLKFPPMDILPLQASRRTKGPGGEEGSLEALKCSACNCHRNFHRKEIDGECSYDCHHHYPIMSNIGSGRLISGHHNGIIGSPPQGYPTSSFISSRAPPPHQVVVSHKNGGANAITSESDEKEEDNGGGILTTRPVEKLRKRFRTKFTEEQKQKMLNFAEKAGWKMQKLEESVVQGLCQELGIKRRVLKVWMHNNKHNYVKNSTSS